MEVEEITIPRIILEWSKWISWDDFRIDARHGGGVRVPTASGVYEVRYRNEEERLHIGKASDLRMRIKQGLVKGKARHSTGKRIRTQEDVSKIIVRWAVTNRPACAEEELHKRHRDKFGRLPKHTMHT